MGSGSEGDEDDLKLIAGDGGAPVESKRMRRLEMNRLAAQASRRKKKEWVANLEETVEALTRENTELRLQLASTRALLQQQQPMPGGLSPLRESPSPPSMLMAPVAAPVASTVYVLPPTQVEELPAPSVQSSVQSPVQSSLLPLTSEAQPRALEAVAPAREAEAPAAPAAIPRKSTMALDMLIN